MQETAVNTVWMSVFSEGIELTKEEAEAYLAELEDFELDSDVLQKVAGGGVYDTVSTIIKEVPNVVKNI